MGFYSDNPGDDLRLGDVVIGFPVATPAAHDKEPGRRSVQWQIRAVLPDYLVVMTPCCSIEKKCLLLAPLGPIRPSFLKNEWWREDLTHLNRTMPWEKSLPPEHLAKMSEEDRAAGSLAPPAYAFGECFIYPPHPILGAYALPMKPTPQDVGHYMIDFKTVFRLECDFINRPAKAPPGTKLLELAIPARRDLRAKLAQFFARVPEEDLVPG